MLISMTTEDRKRIQQFSPSTCRQRGFREINEGCSRSIRQKQWWKEFMRQLCEYVPLNLLTRIAGLILSLLHYLEQIKVEITSKFTVNYFTKQFNEVCTDIPDACDVQNCWRNNHCEPLFQSRDQRDWRDLKRLKREEISLARQGTDGVYGIHNYRWITMLVTNVLPGWK